MKPWKPLKERQHLQQVQLIGLRWLLDREWVTGTECKYTDGETN